MQNLLVHQGGLDKFRKVRIGPGAYNHDPPQHRANYYKNETSSFAARKLSLDIFTGGPAAETASYNSASNTYSLPVRLTKNQD